MFLWIFGALSCILPWITSQVRNFIHELPYFALKKALFIVVSVSFLDFCNLSSSNSKTCTMSIFVVSQYCFFYSVILFEDIISKYFTDSYIDMAVQIINIIYSKMLSVSWWKANSPCSQKSSKCFFLFY